MPSHLAPSLIAVAVVLAGTTACIPDWTPPSGMGCAAYNACGTTDPGSPWDTDPGDGPPTTGDGVQTVTGDSHDPDADSSSTAPDEQTGGTTEQAVLPPQIVDGVVIPDYIDENGFLEVVVSTEHAEGVRMLLDNGELIELTPVRPGQFVGQIFAYSGLNNGKRTAVLTPWRNDLEGESVNADYVIALPPPGYEIGWHADGIHGSVAAIAVLPDGRPVEFGTFQEMGAPRCYMRLRDKKGQPLEKLVPVLASSYCRAIDLKIDPDTGRINLLVERKIGDDPVWWAGEMSAWGKGLKNIGIGEVGDTARALAARPDVVAVCGSRAVVSKDDKFDALAVLLRPGELPQVRVFDHNPSGDPDKEHLFSENARDCAFSSNALVLVGEAHGMHEDNKFRDRLMVIESDLAAAADGDPVWTVVGLDQGVQTRALALAIDDKGRYHLAGYTCFDTCEPIGEVRVYAPGGKLVAPTASLGPLGSAWFGPHDIAWSPAGYAVVALGELQGQNFVFKVQAFAPGVPGPLWTFLPNSKQGLQLALALAIGRYGEVYAGGIGATDHPAFACIAS